MSYMRVEVFTMHMPLNTEVIKNSPTGEFLDHYDI